MKYAVMQIRLKSVQSDYMVYVLIEMYTINYYYKIYVMSKVHIKPLADRVLVEPAAAEEKTVGGIIIPDSAKEKPQKGEIIAVGPGKKDEPMTVKVGDKVLYGQYSGTELQIDGKLYLIMKESDIYAIA
ncbi:Chaperonin 10 Kd subunit [Cardinium endosymbiont of Sogatella furcifera]|nr:Chaperonin 10 Kd subunit [Cardinium endosymbiont of Sogatella furcifera]